MKKINRILVGLDLTPMDELLLSSAKYYGQVLQAKQITGAHIIPALLVGGAIKVEAGHVFRPIAPAVGKIEEEIAYKTKKWIAPGGMNFDTKVLEGKPYQEMLKLVEKHHVDLLIIGKKEDPVSHRITAGKIARNASCDLLVVPQHSFPIVEKILVPVDFSKQSAKALERAIYLNNELKTAPELECVYVEENPFFKRAVASDSAIMELHELPLSTKDKFENFKEEYPEITKKIKFTFLESKYDIISTTLQNYADQMSADLIVMGARGKNWTERLIYGTVAEAMLKDYFITPIYIVR